MRNKLWTLAALALVSLAAFAQAPLVGSTIDAKTGFKVNGAAPSGHALCGNGTVYIDSANACGILFYQTIHNPLGTTMPQEPVLTLLGEFTCADFAGASTQCDLAHVGTAGTYANPISVQTDAFGRVINITAGSATAMTQATHLGSASCSPAGTSFATCTDAMTWPAAFADTNYRIVCNPVGPISGGSGSNSLLVYAEGPTDATPPTTTGFTAVVVNNTSDAGTTAADISCIGVHN